MIRNASEFLNIAFKAYDNPKIVALSDFEADVKRINYLNLAISKYLENKDLYFVRLGLNHMVIIRNCFGSSTYDLIMHKTPVEHEIYVKTMMYFLGIVEKVEFLDFDLLNKLETLS